MSFVLKADASVADAYVEQDIGTSNLDLWITCRVLFDSAALALWIANGEQDFVHIENSARSAYVDFVYPDTAWNQTAGSGGTPIAGEWHLVESHTDATGPDVADLYIDGALIATGSGTSRTGRFVQFGQRFCAVNDPASVVYIADVLIGTSRGASDIFSDDFSSGDFSAWSSTSGDVSVVEDPTTPATNQPGRRVGVAFDDGPLEPDPTWTWLDDATVFPPQFVSGYDTSNGRQTLISQTETGTATVYVNDRAGLFDDRNFDSPYIGKLSGRQIILQLWNPVTETWEPQFRGIIDAYNYDIDAATDAHGEPINASIQLECVDILDYLNGYGLTPGLDGHVPTPAGMEDGVWYEQTTGTVQDRFITILENANVDPSRYHLAQGNVNVIGVKYDPDESALTALRDAADAELPFIANLYVDRYGRFVFRGRYSRFYPDDVSAEPGSDWDFQRWPLGDGKAIQDDPSRGQVRVLSFTRSRADIINAAIAWAQGISAADMPDQVYAATGSIDDFGKHQAPPMGDLLMCEPFTYDPQDKNEQAALYAQLLVENKKQPHMEITRLQLKAMRPDDHRAEATWGAICGADISHIVNVAVGYPGGVGFTGDTLNDDHYIEGRSLTVRPLNPTHDYVECDLNVSPAIWSMDTFGVFFNPFDD